jgi:hypothetical protein
MGTQIAAPGGPQGADSHLTPIADPESAGSGVSRLSAVFRSRPLFSVPPHLQIHCPQSVGRDGLPCLQQFGAPFQTAVDSILFQNRTRTVVSRESQESERISILQCGPPHNHGPTSVPAFPKSAPPRKVLVYLLATVGNFRADEAWVLPCNPRPLPVHLDFIQSGSWQCQSFHMTLVSDPRCTKGQLVTLRPAAMGFFAERRIGRSFCDAHSATGRRARSDPGKT